MMHLPVQSRNRVNCSDSLMKMNPSSGNLSQRSIKRVGGCREAAVFFVRCAGTQACLWPCKNAFEK